MISRYKALYAGGAYAPTWYQRRITRQVHEFAAEFGIGPSRSGAARRIAAPEEEAPGPPAAPDPAQPTQLTLI